MVSLRLELGTGPRLRGLRYHLSTGGGRELRQENQEFKASQEQGKTLSQKEPQATNLPTYPPSPSFCTRNLRRTAGSVPF